MLNVCRVEKTVSLMEAVGMTESQLMPTRVSDSFPGGRWGSLQHGDRECLGRFVLQLEDG